MKDTLFHVDMAFNELSLADVLPLLRLLNSYSLCSVAMHFGALFVASLPVTLRYQSMHGCQTRTSKWPCVARCVLPCWMSTALCTWPDLRLVSARRVQQLLLGGADGAAGGQLP